ncbi:hypothetical protein K474DRAFT_1373317 [Panus rudis PR-1116 ss-1]|nr:hypothetical protein K474DRAFT_1373317 [Panus rudis PR-1116 ss-1]
MVTWPPLPPARPCSCLSAGIYPPTRHISKSCQMSPACPWPSGIPSIDYRSHREALGIYWFGYYYCSSLLWSWVTRCISNDPT